MQLVLEVISQHVEPIKELLSVVIGIQVYKVRCLPVDSDTYVETSDTLESAAKARGWADLLVLSSPIVKLHSLCND